MSYIHFRMKSLTDQGVPNWTFCRKKRLTFDAHSGWPRRRLTERCLLVANIDVFVALFGVAVEECAHVGARLLLERRLVLPKALFLWKRRLRGWGASLFGLRRFARFAHDWKAGIAAWKEKKRGERWKKQKHTHTLKNVRRFYAMSSYECIESSSNSL